jgi:hypothetical protein
MLQKEREMYGVDGLEVLRRLMRLYKFLWTTESSPEFFCFSVNVAFLQR